MPKKKEKKKVLFTPFMISFAPGEKDEIMAAVERQADGDGLRRPSLTSFIVAAALAKARQINAE
jgi:hypothetical protein